MTPDTAPHDKRLPAELLLVLGLLLMSVVFSIGAAVLAYTEGFHETPAAAAPPTGH